ncbi:hypothetical protein P3T73_03810 [Kiritimatiellota bacterium B12222]|nr:hypothetical protein P3T73_03810 [Kiritimatiellota bacterium B12222]
MKKFLFVLLMLVVVVVAVVFVFLQKLDGIVENAIETKGTEALGQKVSVAAVNIELKNGMGEISGLTIANPEGFADPDAFQMDLIRLAIDVKSISKNPVVLNELIIEAPVVSLEIQEDGSSNLDEIIAHLKAQNAKQEAQPTPTATAEAEKAPTAEDLLIAIGTLKIAGVELSLRHPKFGDEPKEFVLPDISLKNVGGDEGITALGLTEVVVESIAKEGAKQALKAEANKQASKLLNKASSSLMKKFSSEENIEVDE